MAKNISILEQAVSRTFGSVEKLETNLVGGGTQLWIPEDEAVNYVELEDLDVTENGYYTPSGDGFKSVSVEVETEPELEEIEITENGTYTPTSGVGFSSVSVEVQSESGGDSPEISGQTSSAVASVDITAGQTVAIQDDSHEPISVSCPLPDRQAHWRTGVYSALKFDGKNVYWVAGVDNYTLEVRKKPISALASESYTVVGQIPTSWGGAEPWYTKAQNLTEEVYTDYASVFTNRVVRVGNQGMRGFGRAVSIDGNGIYDMAMKKVNDQDYQNAYNAWRMISGARVLVQGGGGDFVVQLLGGDATHYTISNTSAFDIGTWNSGIWGFAGNNALFSITDTNNGLHLMYAPFDETESEEPISVEMAELCELNSLTYNFDTSFDRWVFDGKEGLVVVQSDLTMDTYQNLTIGSQIPYLVGDYVFLGESCYKLTSPEAVMVPTSAKGAEGALGVAKHNVRAGETGEAIVLFS